MVLAEMGGRIKGALQQMNNATIIDDKVFTDCLNEISRALLAADVQFKMIVTLQTNIKRTVSLKDRATGHNKRKIIQQAVFEELCNMLDPGKPAFVPKKGTPNVIMFVGLQGAGKTTTCTKYASKYRPDGWKPALVCADTFRAGAFDQLKQNATKVQIPFYGSYTETDPVKIAREGVERFKKENCDLIIVDTSGRHKQEASLLEEMRQLAQVTNPDLVIFVMDSSLGQAAFDQAQAFKQSVAVGAVIVTKVDGHAKGGGALAAVAATKSPIIFLGTGERMDEFEAFETKAFVGRLLGLADWSGFMDKVHEVAPMDLLQKLQEGKCTLSFVYELYQTILNMGPLGPLVSMVVPSFNQELMPEGGEQGSQAKVKKFMTMMDSMTDEELDSTNAKLMNDSRIFRIARGSGRSLREVHDMLEEHKRLAKCWSTKEGSKKEGFDMQHISKAFRTQGLEHMGGVSGLQNFLQNFNGRNFSGS